MDPRSALAIEQVSIDDLIPYARNSRTHSDAQVAQIAASIREFGFTNPVLIDAGAGIIAGRAAVLEGSGRTFDDLAAEHLPAEAPA